MNATKETRRLYGDDLSKLCISKNWYTKGTCEQYETLLNTVKHTDNITTADIVSIAKDIKEHSETESDLSSICFEIAEICYSFFEV